MTNQILIIVQMAPIARGECDLGSLTGVRKKVPQPFLPLHGHLKRLFSFEPENPTGTWRNLQAACPNLLADSGRLLKPKAPARGRLQGEAQCLAHWQAAERHWHFVESESKQRFLGGF